MDISSDAPNGFTHPILAFFEDPEIEGIFQITENVSRIVNNLKDARLRLIKAVKNTEKLGQDVPNEKVKTIQLEIEENIEKLSALNNEQLDVEEIINRKLREAKAGFKKLEEIELKRAEIWEREMCEKFERHFLEHNDEYFKYEHVSRLESGDLLDTYKKISKLFPVTCSSGDHCAASKKRVALEDESGQESSVPSAELVVGDSKNLGEKGAESAE